MASQPPGAEGAGLTIGLTKEGQNPVPPGFNKKDIKFVILLSGAVVGLAVALKGAGAAAGAGGGGVSTGVIVAGVAVAGGIAGGLIASHNSSKPASTASPTPTLVPPSPTPTPTPTNPPLHFVVADATWSGDGDIDVTLLNSANQSVGTVVPAGCGPLTQRTESVILQGIVPNDTYRVFVTAKSCGGSTPPQIAVAVSVVEDSVGKCTGVFLNATVGGPPTLACTFTVP